MVGHSNCPSAYLSGGKGLHGLIIALLTRYTPYAVSFFFSKISYFSGGNPTIASAGLSTWGGEMLFCFITALKPAPAFKGKVLVK